MFDNLRDFPDTPPYEEEKDELFPELETTEAPAATPVRKSQRRKSKKFLGMTAQQRFLISVMLMFTVLLLGTLAMFVLGRMSIF